MNAFTPAQPGDTPGQVEPDDSRPKPIDAADGFDETPPPSWQEIAEGLSAERDEARHKCESLFELLDQGTAALAAAAEERADLRARLATAERDARQAVTDKIIAHADRYAPADGNFDQQRLRRHLLIAARLADPTTDDEMRGLAAQMLNDIAEKATERAEGGQW